jgi:two-component system, sensor histidine kinase YesM
VRRKIRANKVFLKIFLVTALAVIISVISCLVFILTYFRSNFQDLLFERSRDSVLKMTEQVSNNLEELASLGQIIAFDDSVQKTLITAKKSDDAFDYYSTIQAGKQALKKYVTLRSDMVYDIVLINKNNETLEMNNTYDALFKTEDYSILNSKESGFVPLHLFTYNVNIGYWRVISYVCNVYSKDDYSYIGKIIILAKDQSVIEDLLYFDKNTGINLGLYNSVGKLFYSTDNTRDFRNEYENSDKSRDYYITENLSIAGWNIICCVSGNLINDSINNTYRLIFIILVLVLIFMMIIIYSLVYNITNPLYKLIGGMRRVSGGERSVSVSIHTGDEIEEVSHVFNEMVHDIETRTQELLESQNKENETKIRMLIYQINPHFIYNTLNCVICLARMNDNEGIISLTRTFITLLRGVISTDTNSYTVIQDEISYIDNYIKVLRYSYNNIPFIKWEVDEELLTNEILKQTLYPLVENSIFHGILPVEHPSELAVSIKKWEGDLILVTVADNGRGMNADEVEKLRDQLLIGESVDGKHIGLQNINNRLKLIYGEASAISVESHFGEGTIMSFSYPVSH